MTLYLSGGLNKDTRIYNLCAKPETLYTLQLDPVHSQIVMGASSLSYLSVTVTQMVMGASSLSYLSVTVTQPAVTRAGAATRRTRTTHRRTFLWFKPKQTTRLIRDGDKGKGGKGV